MGGPDPDRNSRVKFLKRCKTLKNKAHQLAQLCDADVYLLIIHPRERYAYNSTGDRSWPPSDEVLEQHYPGLERKNFNEMERCTGDLKRLTQYFATRWESLRSLEDLYKGTESS